MRRNAGAKDDADSGWVTSMDTLSPESSSSPASSATGDGGAPPPAPPVPAPSLAPPKGLSHSASLADLAAEREEADKGLLRRFREDERGQREKAHTAYRARTTSDARVSSPPRGGAGAAAGGLEHRAALGGSSGALAEEGMEEPRPAPFFDFTLPLIRQASVALVDDSFTRCFKSNKGISWNWNCYLWPAWALGVVVRYCILFPIRLACLLLGFVVVMLMMMPVIKLLSFFMDTQKWEMFAVQVLAGSFVLSWSGVVRIHGIRPTPRPGQTPGVFVANHSSMNDFILLIASHPYAVVGQRHTGWVGFLQKHLLGCLHCLWFDRSAESEKKKTGQQMVAHVHSPANLGTPLLVFPEGTCVNNEYVVQFKKSMFELNVPINPIAIKYNTVFVDGYWNSRAESFAAHQFRIMTSWAMVVDIWFMDPVERAPGETGADFARRVQRMIATRAGLKAVDWDGYIKYWRPSDKFLQARQATLAEEITAALGIRDTPHGVELGAARRSTPASVSANSSAATSKRASFSEGAGGGGGGAEAAVAAAVDATLSLSLEQAVAGT